MPTSPTTFRRPSARIRVGGFTLMEMLVVVWIIALLLSILLPGYGKYRAGSRRSTCTANLRVLVGGYRDYTFSNNKLLPGANTSDASSPNFYDWMGSGNTEQSIMNGKLFNYIRNINTYKCSDHVYPWYLNAYAVNGMLNGEQVFDGSTSKRHWSRDMRDAQQLVFIEEDDYRGWNINSWMLAGTESFIDLPAANHLGGDEIGFLDGHVEYWEWKDKDLRTRPKHGATGITFGFSDPGNVDWHRLAPVFRSWPR